MSDDDSAMLRNRAMIVNNLAMLVKNKCNVSASLGGKETLLTVLIAINHKEGTIVLDYGSSAYLNKKLLAVKNPKFNTVFNGIQVAFHVDQVTIGKFKGADCFMIDIPDSLYWYNRREYYRVDTPTLNPAYIDIEIAEPEEDAKLEYKEAYALATAKIQQKLLAAIQEEIAEEQQAWQRAYQKMTIDSKIKAKRERAIFDEEREANPVMPDPKLARMVRLNLSDISMSGCKLINTDPEFSYFLQEQAIFDDRPFVMPHVTVEVSFKILSVRLGVAFRAEDFEELVGVTFLDIPQSIEGAVLRYVQDIERQSGLLNNA
ncbi:MAG: flagellar brake protein [Methylococcales bacterium]|jgi:c-di-GMP-binding flagellar brake protein YcgR|nr:flagellar brake protein [Methylococcales bacterium]